jgi:hypothetical protein
MRGKNRGRDGATARGGGTGTNGARRVPGVAAIGAGDLVMSDSFRDAHQVSRGGE